MLIDLTAVARQADPGREREWLRERRVFISSAMADTRQERRAVADAVEALGARGVWFEEFGRDANPEEAYLGELGASTIYVGVLNELYGRLLDSGFSATETEYEFARDQGKRVAVYVAAHAPGREGHLNRFIERVRTFVVTENYADIADLARRVERRLHELAAEALSPWVKLGDCVFRADEIREADGEVTIAARIGDDVGHVLDERADRHWGQQELRLTYEGRVLHGRLAGIDRAVRDGASADRLIRLTDATAPGVNAMRSGTTGLSADDLVETGLRQLFLGEPLPQQVGGLEFLTQTGIDADALRQCFVLPNEVAEAIARLVVTEGLVGTGYAARVGSFALGPTLQGRRRVALEWLEPRVYSNAEQRSRQLEGDWRRP